MYKKSYGIILLFLLFLFPVKAQAAHHGLTTEQQMEQLEQYHQFYGAAFSNEGVDDDFGMYKIPGLYQAETLSLATNEIVDSRTMTPQGVTLTEKYLLISAYSHDHQNHLIMLFKFTAVPVLSLSF